MTRLLIVEDRFLVAEAMRTALTDRGFEVVGMTGLPDRALEIAECEHPDLALVDVSLSDSRELHGDGIKLASRLRRRHGVPSLFVTGATGLLHGDEGVGCVSKPCSETQLVSAIKASVTLLHDNVLPEELPEGVQLWRRPS